MQFLAAEGKMRVDDSFPAKNCVPSPFVQQYFHNEKYSSCFRVLAFHDLGRPFQGTSVSLLLET